MFSPAMKGLASKGQGFPGSLGTPGMPGSHLQDGEVTVRRGLATYWSL
jgi:hypothetical protein